LFSDTSSYVRSKNSSPNVCVTFRNMLVVYGEGYLRSKVMWYNHCLVSFNTV
jgi:hypothetical protein